VYYVLKYKATKEVQVRLDALRPVKGDVPSEIVQAQKEYEEVLQFYSEAYRQNYRVLEQYCKLLAYQYSSDYKTAGDKISYNKTKQRMEDLEDRRKILSDMAKLAKQHRNDVYKKYNEVLLKQWQQEYPGHPEWDEAGLVFEL
jgi:uncharacterized membrane protein